MNHDHCTCQPGRDHDGSEFGLCPYCEDQAWLDRHYHCANGCEKAMGVEIDGATVCAKCGDEWIECTPKVCS